MDIDRLLAESFVRRVDYHDELPSTNDAALELVGDASLATPTLVVADRQNSGRGRGANRWWSGEGGLTFSLVLEPDAIALETQRWPQLSLTLAVAVCSALEELAAEQAIALKWPNDVFAGGRKICGILIDAPSSGRSGRPRIVAGVGLNVNNAWLDAPEAFEHVGTSLVDLTGRQYDRTEVLVTLLTHFERRLAQLGTRDENLAEDWASRCMLRGRQIAVELGERRISGTCQGIDPEGALLVDTGHEQHRLFGGVVKRFD